MEAGPPPEHPVQLRIEFPQPTAPVVLGLALRGLSVVAAVWEGAVEDACTYLQDLRVRTRVEPGRGIVFPLRDLVRLRELPDQVRVEPLGPATPLVRYALSNPVAPATVTVSPELHLSWYDGDTRHDELLDPEAAAALPGSELPFVATEEAWEALERLAGTPQALGVARLNHDGYVELTTSNPQRLESAPVPGLFRVDATHFGLSAAHADVLDGLRGLEWEGLRPARRRAPRVADRVAELLGPHLHDPLDQLVARLSALRGQVLVCPAGLGRRVLALAALETLEAYPALVVTPPWSLWVWARNADLWGRTVSLTGDDADVRLITYLDLSLRPRLDAFESIVFDDLAGTDAAGGAARHAMAGLGVIDAYRIGICDRWPEDPEEGCALLNMARPGEFELSEQPLSQRYPLRPVQRAEEHAAPYLLRPAPPADGPGTARFRRSEVDVVPASADQLATLRALPADRPARQRLHDACEVLSAGTATGVSPKIAAAHELARAAHGSRRRLVLATRSRRAATMLRATLAAYAPVCTDEAGCDGPTATVTVLSWTRALPDLRGFDEVVLLEYPWSTGLLELAVGPAGAGAGPRRVSVMHTPGTVDDRLAVYAARRRELGATDDPYAPPTDEELVHLLAPRW